MMHTLPLLVALFTTGLDDVARPDLRGKVLDQGGRPVESAAVFIYTAGPRRGTSPY